MNLEKLFQKLKELWWLMSLMIIWMIFIFISGLNVENISRTVKTDVECANTPQKAADRMKIFEKRDIHKKLNSENAADWTFSGVTESILCNAETCTFWDKILLREKFRTLMYAWRSEVEGTDGYRDDISVICFIQGGYTAGSKWTTINDSTGKGRQRILTGIEWWFY